MTSIAAIVCGHTLDRWDDIERSLASLERQTRPANHIVLSIDNNHDLFDRATGAFGDRVTVVHNTGNRGVSAARNVAADATACDVLAYLDDDAVADAHWLERLASWYDDPAVVGVGGTAEPAWDGGRGPAWFPASFNWVVGCSHSGIGAAPTPVRNFIGCNMSIRRSAWKAVGGFYDGLGRVGADGGGGDETDFCIRVTEAVGGTIMNDPAAIVSHRVPVNRQTLRYFLKRCRSEGVSKARISARAGSDRALSEERNHLLRELPRSFFAGVGDALRGDLSGLQRAGAIALGTAATGLGFLRGVVASNRDDEVAYTPSEIVTVDLADPTALVRPCAERDLYLVVRHDGALRGVVRHEAGRSTDGLPDDLRSRFAGAGPLGGGSPATAASSTVSTTAAVVIATRNRADSLRRCLESLAAMRRPADQLIVVDNAPADERTRSMIEAWNRSGAQPIVYVRCERPGLARAHNAALPHLSCDVVAFTDDDVLVDDRWLGTILDAFAVDERIACVTGAILPAELETWPQEWVESSSNFTKGFAPRRFGLDVPVEDPLFPFAAGSMGSGANMAFSVDWLRTHGGFHETLGAGTVSLGGDDLRAFYDVIDSGAQLSFMPDAIVFHHHHRTPEAIERQAHGYGAGLGAYLASVVLDDPSSLGRMVRRAPGAIRHARAVTAAPDGSSFPGERRRTWRQRLGLLTGPVRYLASRR